MSRPVFLSLIAMILFVAGTTPLHAQVSDLKLDWSNTNNPNGSWTYREGTNTLPAVASWQSTLGGWTTAQPGWARSENGNNRLPFWYRSNGSENFTPDTQAGDIVVHATDTVNGVGNGLANVIWTSTTNGFVTVSGNTWIARDIGRANTWSIWKNTTQLTSGVVSSGDPFSRANPFVFSAGSGGAGVLLNIPVVPGDTIMYQLVANNPAAGEFTGVNMTVTLSAVPEPSTLLLIGSAGTAVGGWAWCRRKQRQKSPRKARVFRLRHNSVCPGQPGARIIAYRSSSCGSSGRVRSRAKRT